MDFLKALVSKIRSSSIETIDSTYIIHNSWFLLNDYSIGQKNIFLFKSSNELLIIRNGVIEKGKWESVNHATSSIIIETVNEALFYNILYLSLEYLILQQDGTENYLGFAKQEKYNKQLDLRSFSELTDLYISDIKAELNEGNNRKISLAKSSPKITPQPRKINEISERELNYSFSTEYDSSKLILHKKGNKWGYIDPESNVVIDFIFEDAYFFNEDVASVKLNGKFGYINIKGEMVIPAQFDSSSFFKNGVAAVSIGQDQFKIDKTGQKIVK